MALARSDAAAAQDFRPRARAKHEIRFLASLQVNVQAWTIAGSCAAGNRQVTAEVLAASYVLEKCYKVLSC
jgi:hypothetical protein